MKLQADDGLVGHGEGHVGDGDRVVADALEVDDEAVRGRHRPEPRPLQLFSQRFHALPVDLRFEPVDGRVFVDDLPGEVRVPVDQRLDRVAYRLAGEVSHFYGIGLNRAYIDEHWHL